MLGIISRPPPPALKPPPVIPANVLDHLYRHPDEQVKQFWNQYIQRWQDAVHKDKKERVKTTTEWHVLGPEQYEETIITWPEHDLGEGITEYKPADIDEALFLVNTLLYDVQTKETVNQGQRYKLIRKVASLLDFTQYYDCFYLPDTAFFDARIKPVPQMYGDYLDANQNVLDLLKAFQGSDSDIMRFHLFRDKTLDDSPYQEREGYSYIGYKYRFNTANSSNQARSEFPKKLREYKAMQEDEVRRSFLKLAEEYAVLAKRYASVQAYVSYYRDVYRASLEKQTGGLHRYNLEYFKNDRWNKDALSWWQQYTWDYHREYDEAMQHRVFLYNHGERFPISATIAEWLTALANNEAFVNLMASEGHMSYFDPLYRNLGYSANRIEGASAKTIWQELTRECAHLYAYYGPRDTTEKLLAETRHELEQEIAEFEKKTQRSKQIYDEKTAEVQQELDRKKAGQKARHDRFRNALDSVLAVLMTPDGKIAIPSTEWVDTPISQQTHADREREIANQLTHLSVGQAMVRVPSGEYIIKTEAGKSLGDGFERKRQRILDQTIRMYCASLAEVEEQIRRRQDDTNPPPTTRKHTLE